VERHHPLLVTTRVRTSVARILGYYVAVEFPASLAVEADMRPKVYISVGSAATPEQTAGTDAIFRSLETAGLSPRQMERNEWTAEQPLRGIKRVIDECHGTVVIAFTRYQFSSGIERKKDGSEKPLVDTRITTVWNQIEAAMAYTRGMPLLVIAEHGLIEDGLLEGRYDWKVYWTDFAADQLRSDAFIGYLESWKRLVLAHHDEQSKSEQSNSAAACETDVTKLSLAQLCGQLTLPQLWAALSAVAGALTGVASLAFRAGAGRWPWQ
jgi:hypothetical protein